MPLIDLLREGVNVLLLGMGSVFVFLSTLVVAMAGMSRLARRIEPQRPVSPRPYPASVSAAHPDREEEIIAVISAAIRRYRS